MFGTTTKEPSFCSLAAVHAGAIPGVEYASYIHNMVQKKDRYASNSSQVPKESRNRCPSTNLRQHILAFEM